MISTPQLRNEKLLTVQAQAKRFGRAQAVWLIGMFGITLLLSYGLMLGIPMLYILAWLCFWLCVSAVFYHPRNGIYVIVSLTLLGDPVLVGWYPFNKNFSS